MSRFKVIGLTGKAGSGKDWLAENVVRPMGYMRWALAWPMKNNAVAQKVASWREAHISKPPHVREWLQQEGTERGWMVYGEQYLCNMARAWMETMRVFNGVEKFVFSDIRFPWEVEWIDRLGGLIVHVHSPIREKESGLGKKAREHSSETALDTFSFQYVVDNDEDYERYQFSEERPPDGEKQLHWLVEMYEAGKLPKKAQYTNG